MIKDLNWLQEKLEQGSKEDGTTFIILDKVDCKNILKNISQLSVLPLRKQVKEVID